MPNIIKPPPPEVIHAFGGQGQARKLSGGEGQSFRVGNLVFKPVDNTAQSRWMAQTLPNIKSRTFRLSRPVTSSQGDVIYQGWQAYHFLEGKVIKGHWPEKIALSRSFHYAIKNIPKPTFIGQRQTPWEVADLEVWSRLPLSFPSNIRAITDPLTNRLSPLRLPEQLIHGDMTGNILFHPNLPPAIIDFSPYYRPATYAIAIIIVDAIVWERGPDKLIHELENTPQNNQLLLRAALWRIKTSQLFAKLRSSSSLIQEISHYHPFIDLLVARMSQ